MLFFSLLLSARKIIIITFCFLEGLRSLLLSCKRKLLFNIFPWEYPLLPSCFPPKFVEKLLIALMQSVMLILNEVKAK